MSNRKILVTGGAGYVGSHACLALAEAGYQPIVLDNLERGHASAVQWGPLEKVDLRDRAMVESVITRHAPEGVLHFAALTYVGESVEVPHRYYETNVLGTLHLLAAMRKQGIDRIVFSSTCAVYGEPQKLPLTEDHPHAPLSPYGETKHLVERMLQDFHAAYGLRSVALRYFNAAGADEKGRIGEDHQPEFHAIPILLDVAKGKRPQFKVYGSDYPTPDGTCIRDYVHVTDLATAHVAALRRLENEAVCEAYNLGSEKGFSVLELISAVERVTQKKIPFEKTARRRGDAATLVGDSTLARKILEWNPKNSDLNTLVRTAWNWHQKLK